MTAQQGYREIEVRDLRQWMNEGRSFLLIDTLPGERFEKIHIPGARNACVFQVIFPDEVQKIASEKDQPIVLYGSSSATMDGVTAAEKLVRMGYQKVFTLTGGIAAWRATGYPLEGKSIDEWQEAGAAFRLEDRIYQVDCEKSTVEWAGRNANTRHHGTLCLASGEITVKEGAIGGTFEIDMKSIKNIDLEGDALQPVLTSHLRSDDFFFVTLFPKATFTISSAKLVENPTWSAPNFEVKGTLELRGVQKEISFPATVNHRAEGGVTIEAHFDIDRTRWKILYGSSRFFEHLGIHLVFDLISLQLRILAQ